MHFKTIVFVVFLIAVLAGVYLMLQLTIPYFSFKYDVDFLLTKQHILHVKWWRYAFYIHIALSIPILLFGAFQFLTNTKYYRPKMHRNLGKVYVFLVLGFSAPSAFIMAIYANGGFWSKTSFLLTAFFWWYFTFKAFTKVKQSKFDSHKNYMIRSYALTLSALTLRLYVLILPFFLHLHAKEMYTLVAWLSWVPNLLIAEIIIRKNWVKTPALVQNDH